MALFLDSALVSEARTATQFGWVQGITTNPTLLAQSPLPPGETLKELAGLTSGPIFYQLTASSVAEMVKEARQANDLLGSQLVCKIPPTKAGFTVTSELSGSIPCAVTAVFAPAQAMVAEAAGARYVILYYHRAILNIASPLKMVFELVSVLAGSSVELIAASLKSPEEVVAARIAGIRHHTLPLGILQQMVENELSQQAVDDFAVRGRGIFTP